MVVFTKYDRLVMSKKDEFGDDQGNEAANRVYDDCVKSLKNIVSKLELSLPELLYVKVSVSGIISHSLSDRCHG